MKMLNGIILFNCLLGVVQRPICHNYYLNELHCTDPHHEFFNEINVNPLYSNVLPLNPEFNLKQPHDRRLCTRHTYRTSRKRVTQTCNYNLLLI